MKSPTWETSVGALAAFLNAATAVYFVDLYTFTLSGGSVIRYNGSEQAVTVNGVTYPVGPAIKPPTSALSIGIDTKSLLLEMSADTSVTVNGVPFLKFVAAGGFDGATVRRDRAFAASPSSAWVGTLNMFTGTESETDISRYQVKMTVNSDTQVFDVQVPRNLYQPGCLNTLFDGACLASRASFSAAATATSNSDPTGTFFSTGLAQATDYFALGWALGLTGSNAGVRRTVKAFASGVITTVNAWPAAVAIGDTFTVFAGCDKTQATCNSKFANLVHFRGMPYVPAPETVL